MKNLLLILLATTSLTFADRFHVRYSVRGAAVRSPCWRTPPPRPAGWSWTYSPVPS